MKPNRNPSSESRAGTCGQMDVHDDTFPDYAEFPKMKRVRRSVLLLVSICIYMSLSLCHTHTFICAEHKFIKLSTSQQNSRNQMR